VLIALVALVTLAAAACTTPGHGGGGGGGTTYAVTVTAPTLTMTYGGAVPTITPSYAGLALGQTQPPTPPTCVTTATSTSPAGVYVASCQGAAGTNETFSYVDGTVTIDPAPAVVTASSASIGLGDPIPMITPSYSGLTNGDTAPATSPSCGTAATGTSPAGVYLTTCSGAADPNYTFSYVNGTLGVGVATVTVTASSGSTTYGDLVPAVTAAYSGFVNGETAPGTLPTCTTTASSSSNVGSYTTSCSGAADPNYVFTYVDGTDSITPAAATITASSSIFSVGATPPDVTPIYGGLKNGDTGAATAPTCSTTATSSSPAGPYTTTCSGASDPNYTFSYVDGVDTVVNGPAPATVTASSPTMTYGGPVPAITPSYAGFTGGQTVPATTAATCSTTATSSSSPGTYPTTCSGASDPHYTFSYVDGTITVLAKAATVTASSSNMIYGGTVPTITPTYGGLVNGDTAPATLPTCSTTATSTSNVGVYPSTCVGAADPNYTFSVINGSVNVAPADATVSASSGTFTYGGTVPTITATYGGLLNGTMAPATLPTCSTTATSSSSVGSYPSTCAGAADPNYNFSYSGGTVSVTAAAATITASSPSIPYGTTPSITPLYSGLVNGNTGAATPPTCSTTADSSSLPGTYPTTCSGASDPNYTFSYAGGTLTVTPAPVTVTASSASMNQGDTPPTITASYSGFVNGDSAPATLPTCSTTATSSSPAGPYPSSCTGAADPNYTFSYVNGTVTVIGTNTGPIGYVSYGADQETSPPPTGSEVYYQTFTTAQVVTNTSANNPIAIPVSSSQPWAGYQSLTAQTAGGPIGIFCKGASGLGLGACYSSSVHTTIPSGSLITNAPFATFDVYSIIPGGKSVVKPTSVTVVTDAPAADRALPTYVGATSSFGLLKLYPNTTVTGTFQLTFGYCTTATTYNASDPSCHTGVLQYGPSVDQSMGALVSVTVGTLHINQAQFEQIGTAVVAPATAPAGTNYTAYISPESTQVPHLQPTTQLGDVTVNSVKTTIEIFPIPAGATYVSSSLMGGDSSTSGEAVLTYCLTKTSPGCVAQTSQSYVDTTAPYLQMTNPSLVVPGGGQGTLPTVAMTLNASGPLGTNINIGLSEVTIATSTSAAPTNFRAYPTDGSLGFDPSGNPLPLPMTVLGTTKIS
jgi:hypothetical protein